MASVENILNAISLGVDDIDTLAEVAHIGWSSAASIFIANPDIFSDTFGLPKDVLDRKIKERKLLVNTPFRDLGKDEQDKDRVVAKAILNKLEIAEH